jgi:hypothetical protein
MAIHLPLVVTARRPAHLTVAADWGSERRFAIAVVFQIRIAIEAIQNSDGGIEPIQGRVDQALGVGPPRGAFPWAEALSARYDGKSGIGRGKSFLFAIHEHGASPDDNSGNRWYIQLTSNYY